MIRPAIDALCVIGALFALVIAAVGYVDRATEDRERPPEIVHSDTADRELGQELEAAFANARRRALGLEQWRSDTSRSIADLRERRVPEIKIPARPDAQSVATNPKLSPPRDLVAKAGVRGARVDVYLTWRPPLPGDDGPPPDQVLYELWRWKLPDGLPERIARHHRGETYVDRGLLGQLSMGYAIHVVTKEAPYSTSRSCSARIDLPRVFEISLIEPDIPGRTTPPPEDPEELSAPAESPRLVAFRIRRTSDRIEQDVAVQVGESVGQTGFTLVETRWKRVNRPVRFQVPVFENDGRVAVDGEFVRRKSQSFLLPVFLPEVVLRDSWGREHLLGPRRFQAGIEAGTENQDR